MQVSNSNERLNQHLAHDRTWNLRKCPRHHRVGHVERLVDVWRIGLHRHGLEVEIRRIVRGDGRHVIA